MIDKLLLFFNVLIVLMMAIYLNHTERLILQLKEDIRKLLVDKQDRKELVSGGIFIFKLVRIQCRMRNTIIVKMSSYFNNHSFKNEPFSKKMYSYK